MPKRLKKNIELLKLLKKCKNKNQIKVVLELADNDLIRCICDCTNNILLGNVKLSKKNKKNLENKAKHMRELLKPKKGIKKKRKYLIQHGGFILPALLTPIIGLASGLIGEVVGKLVK